MSKPLEKKDKLGDLLNRSDTDGGGEHISPSVSKEVLENGEKVTKLLKGLNADKDNELPTKK